MARIAEAELRRLRNDIDIEQLITRLRIPHKWRDGYLRFCCPLCSDFHSATNPDTNLARCFRCQKNFNPIELVMAVANLPFPDAVTRLRPLLRRDPQLP